MTVDAGPLAHKDYVLPEVDLSQDQGDPEWAGESMVPEPGRTTFRWLRAPGAYSQMWQGIQDEWRCIVEDYERFPADFGRAWHYVDSHPAFWTFTGPSSSGLPSGHVVLLEHSWGMHRAVDVSVGRVDEDLPAMVGLEAGRVSLHPDEYGHITCHDYDLDTLEPTYEQAVISLARKVWESYGNDRRICDADV